MHLHKWTKWEQYDQKYYILPGYLFRREWDTPQENHELRQRRYCKICNKMQDKRVVRSQ